MLKDWKFWVVTALGAFALIMTFANMSQYSSNRDRQVEVIQRQQFINEANQLSQFNSQFIQALANLSAQTGDENIRKLLADHGITYTVNQPAPETPNESEAK